MIQVRVRSGACVGLNDHLSHLPHSSTSIFNMDPYNYEINGAESVSEEVVVNNYSDHFDLHEDDVTNSLETSKLDGSGGKYALDSSLADSGTTLNSSSGFYKAYSSEPKEVKRKKSIIIEADKEKEQEIPARNWHEEYLNLFEQYEVCST